VKNIAVQSEHCFFDSLSNTLVMCDEFGKCQPLFLNLYKQKQHKGKAF